MFDVSFIQIVLVCVVALVVLGPDKLPGTIRVVGLWVGRLKRSFNNIKAEVEKEVGADEIRRQLRNEAIMEKIKNTKSQFTNSIESVKKEATTVASSIKPEGLDELKKDFDSVTGTNKTDNTSSADVKPDDVKPAEKKPEPAPALPADSKSTEPAKTSDTTVQSSLDFDAKPEKKSG